MAGNGMSNPLDFDELTEIIRQVALTASLLIISLHSTGHGDLGGV
jgi:hypothetical protein